jgi:UDP-glucose 4-epimerase
MTWLVTGGAGYIGAHVVRALATAGMTPVVLDDLSSGHRTFVPEGIPLIHGSITDSAIVRSALRDHRITGVIHLAGFKYAGVSVDRPLACYRANVVGTQVLLESMAVEGVTALVFSSSAAVYGTPDVELVTESTPGTPQSPYGESKLIGEWLIRDVARATDLRQVALRYFNVVGSGSPEVYDSSPHNLFPLLFAALTEGRRPRVFGADYPTPDGSCVRDYIHVVDVAEAHVAAARQLASGTLPSPVYNLGRGNGVSVWEIMAAVREATGIPFEPEVQARRPGDPARIVASPALARAELGWSSRFDLADMVNSSWAAARATAQVAAPTSVAQSVG